MPVFQLTKDLIFPNPELSEKDGLLAIGGDLSPERLLLAYQNGIFPWFNQDDPILWWSPDPRFVLFPNDLKISKSMRQILRKNIFEITFNQDFKSVIKNCQNIKRNNQQGTWITDEMFAAYLKLHEKGFAHSVEVWHKKELVGGLYGIILGKCFFGESMFALVSNASKAGFIHLVLTLKKQNFHIVDCQVHTKHLESLGAKLISRKDFLNHL